MFGLPFCFDEHSAARLEPLPISKPFNPRNWITTDFAAKAQFTLGVHFMIAHETTDGGRLGYKDERRTRRRQHEVNESISIFKIIIVI